MKNYSNFIFYENTVLNFFVMGANKDYLIFVVEDNKMYNHLVAEYLKKNGFTNVKSFLTGKEFLQELKKGVYPDIVVQDYFLEDTNGLDVMIKVKKISHKSEFIFLTGNESMEVAVNSIKFGAYDYIIKDSDVALKKLVNKVQKISRLIELQRRNKVINQIMIISLFVLVLIILFSILHFFFDTFGLKVV